MRLSELLTFEVVDERGRSLGRVRDVRLDADRDEAERSPPRDLAGTHLLVGSGFVAERLGYAYGPVRGPAIVRWLMKRWAHGLRVVPVADVAQVSAGRIVASVDREGLPPLERRDD
ncbi:MAG TPA: PRC-barrel domain-containing protein [Actinomycetota bacterium]|nr:PRC-barrel domain-containing protein [Actinomycetota bacterium]